MKFVGRENWLYRFVYTQKLHARKTKNLLRFFSSAQFRFLSVSMLFQINVHTFHTPVETRLTQESFDTFGKMADRSFYSTHEHHHQRIDGTSVLCLIQCTWTVNVDVVGSDRIELEKRRTFVSVPSSELVLSFSVRAFVSVSSTCLSHSRRYSCQPLYRTVQCVTGFFSLHYHVFFLCASFAVAQILNIANVCVSESFVRRMLYSVSGSICERIVFDSSAIISLYGRWGMTICGKSPK